MNDRQASRAIPLAGGLGQLAGRYDGLLVDLWGCLHDGIAAYPAAVDALRRFRERGGRVVLISNAPRRSEAVVRQLDHFGVPRDAWDAVMTAGEAVRLEIEEGTDPWYAALGRRFHHIGTERDADLLAGLDRARAAAIEEANFVLCCGIRESSETIEDFKAELAECRARNLPLVSANPDRFVLRGTRRELCAGSLAAAYVEMGGAMRQEGKPHPAIYRRCRALMGGIPAGRVLALGDGIETDVLGARDAGMDAVWVTGGLPAHFWGLAPDAEPPADKVEEACRDHGVAPLAVMPLLRW